MRTALSGLVPNVSELYRVQGHQPADISGGLGLSLMVSKGCVSAGSLTAGTYVINVGQAWKGHTVTAIADGNHIATEENTDRQRCPET